MQQHTENTALSGVPVLGRRALIIEDEPSIRELCIRALSAVGFDVDTAGDAAEANEKLLYNYDLVFMDFKIPGTSGAILFNLMQTINPGLVKRTVFTSGDVMDAEVQSLIFKSGRPCLAKPFSAVDLRDMVRQAMGLAGDSR